VLATIVSLAMSPRAVAGAGPELSTGGSHLKWQVAKRPSAQSATAASAQRGNSATQKAIWQAPGGSGRRVPPGVVVQASTDKSDLFQDPFEDDPVDTSAGDATTRTSQPTVPDTAGADAGQPAADQPLSIDQVPSGDEPSRLDRPSDPFPEERVPDPLDQTLPENQPAMPGMAPPLDMSCDDYKRQCDEAIRKLRDRDITKIIFGMVIEGEGGQPPVEGKDYPCECVLGLRSTFTGRNWEPTTFTWKATGTCFKPLYFQDVALERYGHSWNPVVQPFASAAHFFISVPLLPYKMGLNPPGECEYTLGYYRPGSCAPYMIEPIPLSLRAGAFQALGATAFGFWFWAPPTGP
jgi:hypothetical protein